MQDLDDAVGLGQGWTWQLPQLGMSLLRDAILFPLRAGQELGVPLSRRHQVLLTETLSSYYF